MARRKPAFDPATALRADGSPYLRNPAIRSRSDNEPPKKFRRTFRISRRRDMARSVQAILIARAAHEEKLQAVRPTYGLPGDRRAVQDALDVYYRDFLVRFAGRARTKLRARGLEPVLARARQEIQADGILLTLEIMAAPRA